MTSYSNVVASWLSSASQSTLGGSLNRSTKRLPQPEKEPLMVRSMFTDSGLGSEVMQASTSSYNRSRPSSLLMDDRPCTSRQALGQIDESDFPAEFQTDPTPIGTCWMMSDRLSVESGESEHDWDGYMNVGEEKVKIRDVCDLLTTRYAFVSGAKTTEGYQIITFPDVRITVPFPCYRQLITYVLNVLPLEDSYHGYVVVIDRRLDRWPSVKMVLSQLMHFFPGTLHAVFLLKPEGVLQKAIEFGYRNLIEQCRFKVLILSTVQELHNCIKPASLTLDLAGRLKYNHIEWVQNRMDIERMRASTNMLSKTLEEFDQCLRDTEMPNDVSTTQHLLDSQKAEREAIKEDFKIAVRKGLSLLQSVRQANMKPIASQLSPTRLHNVTTIERMLVQLEETEKNFDKFWKEHEYRLKQCLQLRQFENRFRQLQANFASHMLHLEENREVGENAVKAQELLVLHSEHAGKSKVDVIEAEDLQKEGESLICEGHYATDASLRPKCQELRRLADALQSAFSRRMEILKLSKTLHEQIAAANTWCSKGVHLLSNIPIELSTKEESSNSLSSLTTFLTTAENIDLESLKNLTNPELKNLVLMATTDTSTLLQQVIARIDDVKLMCERRVDQLNKIAEKETKPRPVQPVSPERQIRPGDSTESLPVQLVAPERKNRKQKMHSPTKKQEIKVLHDFSNQNRQLSLPVIPSPTSSEMDVTSSPVALRAPDSDLDSHESSTLAGVKLEPSPTSSARREDFVIQELLQTEATYVSEVASVLSSYFAGFSNRKLQPLIPQGLVGQESKLFGNLDEIFRFHKETFLNDLNAAADVGQTVENETTSTDQSDRCVRISQCFIKHNDLFHLYDSYCQNKPASDALRHKFGDANPFFQACQRIAGHRLPLGAYLLKPVQRITKYQLLLKELHKCMESSQAANEVNQAVTCMLDLLTSVNASMHQVHISGFPGNLCDLGQLQMQGKFSIWSSRRVTEKAALPKLRRTSKAQQRHLFLYSKALLFCKQRQQANPTSASLNATPSQLYYEYKFELPIHATSVTEDAKGSENRFELITENRSDVYILQPLDVRAKAQWMSKLKYLVANPEIVKSESVSLNRPISWSSMASGDSSSRSSRELSSTPEYNERVSPPSPPESDTNNNPPTPELATAGEPSYPGSFVSTSTTDVTSSDTDTRPVVDNESNLRSLNSVDQSDSENNVILLHPKAIPASTGSISGGCSNSSKSSRVLFNYKAETNDELSLIVGESVSVVSVPEGSWCLVERVETEERGWVPLDYLQTS